MPTKPSPLLCELHAHTTWSDGALDVRRLCDLYGQSGFDVLAVTDHVTRAGDHVNARRFDDYLAEIEREAARAARMYGLLNRDTLFDWVAGAGLPGIANGDFHRFEHLGGWKTLIPSVRSEDAVVDYLRSRRPAYLVRLDGERRLRAASARRESVPGTRCQAPSFEPNRASGGSRTRLTRGTIVRCRVSPASTSQARIATSPRAGTIELPCSATMVTACSSSVCSAM